MLLNLLPDIQKEFLRNRRRLRELLVTFLVLGMFLASFGVNSFALKSEISSRVILLTSLVDSERLNLERGGLSKVEKSVEERNLLLQTIAEFVEPGRKSFIELIDEIDSARPPEVLFTSFTYSQKTMIVEGKASTREDLLRFRDNLKKKGLNFDFDENSWIKPVEAEFRVTFYLSSDSVTESETLSEP